MEDPPRKYFRLAPGQEVRLKHAYYITCTDVIKDADGRITELHCSYDPNSRGGWTEDGRKVKGTLHWVSVAHAKDAEVRMYSSLFTRDNPSDGKEGKDFLEYIDPGSLVVLKQCKIEPALLDAKPDQRFQFLRQGYFCADSADFSPEQPVFNRTVPLRDTWARIQKNQG